MSTKTASRSASAEREHHRTSLWAQLARFVGLFLSPIIGLFGAWLVHIWVVGIHVHHGRVNWDVDTSPAAVTVAVCLVTLATVGTAYLGWQFAEHRKSALRGALAGSITAVGLMFAINVGTGPSFAWSPLFVLVCWLVAVIWSVARLDVTRNDKRSDEEHEDSFLEKVNLKGWRARKVTPVSGADGKPLATEIEFQHAPGDTVDQLRQAVPAFESVSSSPKGFSRATDGERADRSTITVQHVDTLARPSVIPPVHAPGGSIREGLLTGKYADGSTEYAYLAGGNGFSASSYMFMGVTRAGKTWGENTMLTDAGSRRDVVILYLNQAKGMQDIQPIIPIIEAAVIADEQSSAGQYRMALEQIKRLMTYRQRQLALFGIHEWNPEQCWDTPPWRTDGGRRVQMERMPALIVHVGEADTILASDIGLTGYITSKGLSLGVIPGWSLQRASATKMSTDLRFNIGTAWCFGVGDPDSATMALTDWVVKAGAHPENWKARKPGYHYFEGMGIDDVKFPMAARTFSAGPDGTSLREELLRRNLASASRMARLDRGSANATADPGKPNEPSWWDRIVAGTDEIRKRLLAGSAEVTERARAYADDQETYDDEEMQREMRETTHNDDGFELYPADPDTGARASFDDASRPLPPTPPGAVGVSWEDDKPAPRDRKSALLKFAGTLDHLITRDDIRDPADPSGNTVIVTAAMILEEYKYRSRPFFAEVLAGVSQGRIGQDECPTTLVLAAAPDLGATAGKYRLSRPSAGYSG